MPMRLTVEIGLVETVKGEQENRKWTPEESWINLHGQQRWAKPPDLSKAILLEPSKKLLFKDHPTLLRFWLRCKRVRRKRGLLYREYAHSKKSVSNENLGIRKSCSARKPAMHGCAVLPYACYTRASGLASSKWDEEGAAVFSVHSSLLV